MAIVRVQHIGMAVLDFAATCRKFEQIGLASRDFRNDQGKGFQHDVRVLLGNDCWIHVVHNWNPESRVARFLARHGQALEHIALQTDAIEEDVRRLREQNVPIFEDTVFNAADGFEAFVYPDDGIGFTVELIQPHRTSWTYPEDARGRPVSETLGVVRARHVRAVVREPREAAERFTHLFGLPAEEARSGRELKIPLGNPCSLLLTPLEDDPPLPGRREGLVEIGLQTRSLEKDLEYLRDAGVPIREDRNAGPNDGPQAVIAPEDGPGFAIRLGAFE